MKKRVSWVALTAFFSLLVGCAPYKNQHQWPATLSSPSPVVAGVNADGDAFCEKVEERTTPAGVFIPGGYYCKPYDYRTKISSNECTHVAGHTSSDGTRVEEHFRCKHISSVGTYAAPASSSYKPSTGGPVSVRGYHRKDGTYVRPHTRARRR